MKIYFIRHGETDWNKNGKLQGRSNIPLNENGRLVARLTRDALKDVKFDVAFTSPLVRAKETAEILLEGRDIEILEEQRIIEIDFGKYEATAKSEADENIQNFFKEPGKYRAEGGAESLEMLIERGRDFLQELFCNEMYKESTVLVSTHGAALNGMICGLKGYTPAELWKDGLHRNCGITIVEVTDGKPEILEQAIILYDEKFAMRPRWMDR